MLRRSSRALLTLLAVAGLAAPATAQGRRIEAVPFIGGLIPTDVLGSARIPGLGTPITAEIEGVTAAAFGGRLSVWGAGRFGLEGTFAYSASDVRVILGPFNQTLDSEVQLGSVKAMYRATNQATGTDLVVGAGIAGVNHSGEGFQLVSGQFDVGGVVGAGLHIVMSPQVTLRFDGELYMYSWSAGSGFGSKLQKDLLMTVGLGLKLGR